MIEKTVRDYLTSKLNNVPVYLEIPSNCPKKFVFVQKTGSTEQDRIDTSVFAIQSYDETLFKASTLNEAVKTAMQEIVLLDNVGAVRKNSDYPFPDADRKEYRYQSVFEITHY